LASVESSKERMPTPLPHKTKQKVKRKRIKKLELFFGIMGIECNMRNQATEVTWVKVNK